MNYRSFNYVRFSQVLKFKGWCIYGMKVLRKIIRGIVFVAFAAGVFWLVMFMADRYIFHENTEKKVLKSSSAVPTGGIRRTSVTDADALLNRNNRLQYTDVASVEMIADIDIESIAEKLLPSMVSIDCTVRGQNIFGQITEGTSAGSGIYIEGGDDVLYLVTNYHVIENSTSVTATFIDGETYPCTVKNGDDIYDLAVLTVDKSILKPETLTAIAPAMLAESKDVEVGDMVIALGNALGCGNSVTVGYISTLNQYNDETSHIALIQTDAAINPGNSGGALVNINGEVIGINSSKLASDEVEGMGFAIPVSVALPIIYELELKEKVADNEQGFLGVRIITISAADADELGWPAGVYVSEIIEGGAAAESELMAGDIIVGVNNVPIATTEQLQNRITSYRYGTTITLQVQRFENGQFRTLDITVTLKEKTM